jgi:hypothetical protein
MIMGCGSGREKYSVDFEYLSRLYGPVSGDLRKSLLSRSTRISRTDDGDDDLEEAE